MEHKVARPAAVPTQVVNTSELLLDFDVEQAAVTIRPRHQWAFFDRIPSSYASRRATLTRTASGSWAIDAAWTDTGHLGRSNGWQAVWVNAARADIVAIWTHWYGLRANRERVRQWVAAEVREPADRHAALLRDALKDLERAQLYVQRLREEAPDMGIVAARADGAVAVWADVVHAPATVNVFGEL